MPGGSRNSEGRQKAAVLILIAVCIVLIGAIAAASGKLKSISNDKSQKETEYADNTEAENYGSKNGTDENGSNTSDGKDLQNDKTGNLLTDDSDNTDANIWDGTIQDIAVTDADKFTYEEKEDKTIVIKKLEDSSLAAVRIPSLIDGKEVTEIADKAFNECKMLQYVQIPEGVTHIGDRAFYKCTWLRNVDLPDSIEYIGNEAFYYCENMYEISLPDNISYIGSKAFAYCKSLTDIKLPEKIEQIYQETFFRCNSLTEISIPESVKYIDNTSFGNCISLEKVTMGSNVESIGDSAFINCEMLKDIKLSDALKKIGMNAFKDCTSLEKIQLPSKLECIDTGAFEESGLKSIDIPKSVTGMYVGAFMNCMALTDANIEAETYIISTSCFEGCKSLKNVRLSEKNVVISSFAFGNCTSLESIELKNIVSIDRSAFKGCTSLKTVKTQNTGHIINADDCSMVFYRIGIEEGAFKDCTSLESVELTPYMIEISDYAFENCPSLENIKMSGNVRDIGAEAFKESSLKTIYAPSGSYAEKYAKANGYEAVNYEPDYNESDYYYYGPVVGGSIPTQYLWNYISGYTGYMDECAGWDYYGGFIDADYDNDQKTDRVYRTENNVNGICTYRIEFGNGDIITADDNLFLLPDISGIDFDGDGVNEIVLQFKGSYAEPGIENEYIVYKKDINNTEGYKAVKWYGLMDGEYAGIVKNAPHITFSYESISDTQIRVTCDELDGVLPFDITVKFPEVYEFVTEYYRDNSIETGMYDAQLIEEDGKVLLSAKFALFGGLAAGNVVVTFELKEGVFDISKAEFEEYYFFDGYYVELPEITYN